MKLLVTATARGNPTPVMDEAAQELELVRRALTCGLSNCVEWVNDRAALRVQGDPANQGLTSAGIKRLVIDHVLSGGAIEQNAEAREGWRDRRRYWYAVVVPVDGFSHGLFVEMALSDDDPDYPEVALLNAHPQRR